MFKPVTGGSHGLGISSPEWQDFDCAQVFLYPYPAQLGFSVGHRLTIWARVGWVLKNERQGKGGEGQGEGEGQKGAEKGKVGREATHPRYRAMLLLQKFLSTFVLRKA